MKPSVYRKKRGHLVRLSILVQNLANIGPVSPFFQTNIGYISRCGHLLGKIGVIQWEHLFL